MSVKPTTIKINHRDVAFSGRELALLALLSQGETPRTIAESIGVSVSTIYNQLHALLVKLRIRSYEKAIKKAKRLGLLGNIS